MELYPTNDKLFQFPIGASMCLSEKQEEKRFQELPPSHEEFAVTIELPFIHDSYTMIVKAADFNDAVFKAKRSIEKTIYAIKVERLIEKEND